MKIIKITFIILLAYQFILIAEDDKKENESPWKPAE